MVVTVGLQLIQLISVVRPHDTEYHPICTKTHCYQLPMSAPTGRGQPDRQQQRATETGLIWVYFFVCSVKF